MSQNTYHTILGVTYLNGSVEQVTEAGLSAGLVVIPSAPVIVRMEDDAAHREAIDHADLAIIDSGFLVLCWRIFTGKRLERVSGLAYLKALLARDEMRQPGQLAWVMPSASARDTNLRWLNQIGYTLTEEDCFLAPHYPSAGPLDDPDLLEWLRRKRPRHVVLALGGGVQERLGWFLKKQMDYPLGIHCAGAAIGFLSGDQTRIPSWADRYYLGWFFRCLSEPRKFFPRYVKAARLVGLLWRHRRVNTEATK